MWFVIVIDKCNRGFKKQGGSIHIKNKQTGDISHMTLIGQSEDSKVMG